MTNKTELRVHENLILGGISGCFTVTVTYPTDVIRRIAQTYNSEKTFSYKNTLRMLYQSEGIGGFFKGLGITYLKIIPLIGISFSVNEFVKSFLNINNNK